MPSVLLRVELREIGKRPVEANFRLEGQSEGLHLGTVASVNVLATH